MLMQVHFRIFCVYFSSVCMLGGGLHWAFFFTLAGAFAPFDVYAVDEINKQLNQKFDLGTAKNVDGTDIYDKMMDTANKAVSGSDLELEILSRPAKPANDVDLSAYPQIDFEDVYKSTMATGLPEGGKPKAPTMSNGTDIDAQYYEKGGVTFSKDENGNLVTTLVPDSERGAKISSIKGSEVFTNQQERDDEEFNAPANYGDEDAYLEDLKTQYGKTGSGKTMSSEAYRAILKGVELNPAPKIKSNSYFFEQTNKSISDAQHGNGIWSQSCVDETTTTTEKKQIPVWEQFICAQPNHQNTNFCEVTRTLEVNPNYIENLTPQYIEKYTQYPEGCADKVGWKPICPDEECKLTVLKSDTHGPLLLAESQNRIKAGLLDSLRYLDSPAQYSSAPTTATVKINHWGGGTTGLPRFKPVVGYLHIVDDQEWVVLSCERTDYEYSTCVVEKLDSLCDVEEGVPFIHDTGFISPKSEIDSIRYAGLYGITYVIVKDGLQYELSNCQSQGTIPLGSVFRCTATPRKSETCKSDICPVVPACTNYVPSHEVNPFCTFDEWEVIDQGTNNLPQEVISRLARMFEGDPNPAKLYDSNEDGTSGYRVGTWKINAKGYSCDPLKGSKYCASVFNESTEEFEEKCFTYEELQQSGGSCQEYKNNPKCEKTGSSCVEGWLDESSGVCYMYSDDYRCDVSNPIEITSTKTTNVCSSMLPCMGNDCSYGEEESNNQFEKAMVLGSIAQQVDDDATCADADPNTCEIFPGEYEYCSWEVSGLGNNCCEAPSGIDYLAMASMGYKMMQSEAFKKVSSTLSGGVTDQMADKIGGMYSDFSTMLVDGWNAGASAIVDFTSSVMGDPEFMQGAVDAIQIGGETAAEGVVDTLMHQMQQQLYNFLNDLLPDALADMIFQEATDKMISEGAAQAGDLVLGEMASTIMSIISFVGLIYTIYNVVKILANLLTQCDENEQDMGVKIAQKQCFKVGNKYCAKDVLGVCYLRRQDWCCYSSMLSRIIADQGSKQIGKDMAECPGFTIEEFGRIDFDLLDLSEWLSTMYEADILSTTGYDIERLTGSGRMIGNLSCEGSDDPDCQEMNRKTADERATEQFSGDVSGISNQLKDNFEPDQIDCSVYPRPMICELRN
ncbi:MULTISPECIES: conjugal transfer protein TraN [Shewanella]|nr:conjugal transfer protein TraN [Shewanella putrefaciens]